VLVLCWKTGRKRLMTHLALKGRLQLDVQLVKARETVDFLYVHPIEGRMHWLHSVHRFCISRLTHHNGDVCDKICKGDGSDLDASSVPLSNLALDPVEQ
jgi:hypothetical protein